MTVIGLGGDTDSPRSRLAERWTKRTEDDRYRDHPLPASPTELRDVVRVERSRSQNAVPINRTRRMIQP